MTAQVWVDKTRDFLLSGTVEPINRLNGDISDTASSLNVELDPDTIVSGSIIEIGTELMYVTSVSGLSVGVIRGYGGSTAVAHSSLDIIRSNPQYPAHMILDALNDDLNDLSAQGLYQMKVATFTYSASTQGYDLASDVLSVHRVTFTDESGDLSEPEVRRWSLRRNRLSSTFSSGTALVLADTPTSGQGVRVEYKAPFVSLSSSSTALNTVGIHSEAYDLPPEATIKLSPTNPVPSSTEIQPSVAST